MDYSYMFLRVDPSNTAIVTRSESEVKLMGRKPKKAPYYRITPSVLPFGEPRWKCHRGSMGCMPLVTKQTISYERLAPGEPPPPPPPKPTPEQLEAQRLEQARQKRLTAPVAQQDKAKAASGDNAPESPPIGEEIAKLPPFDLQDIPGAMEKMKWPVSAKLLRKWFSSRAYIIPKRDNNTGHPIDDTSITLQWALQFGRVRSRYDELISKGIYNKFSIPEIQKIIESHAREIFTRNRSVENFSTTPLLKDLQKFHNDWQFQFIDIRNYHTNTGYIAPTDMTSSIGSCAIYAAIGNVTVTGPRYYIYNNASGTKRWCMEPKAQVTHIYVYLRDIYEFNDDKEDKKRSQYLGHWNKTGMITTNLGIISELDRSTRILNPDLAEFPAVDFSVSGSEYPVDTRSGWQKFVEKNIYWPVFNRSFNEWREQHKRGGDFVIFTKPVLMRLKKPIELTLEKLCSPEEKMH